MDSYPCRKKGHIVVPSVIAFCPTQRHQDPCDNLRWGLISAGRDRIYRPAEHFLAPLSIGFVFLKSRLLNRRRICTAAWSPTLSGDDSARSRFS
jgi:hypothetical protein